MYLVSQAIKLKPEPSESSLALSCAQYQRSNTEKEWIDLLAANISGFDCIYIFIDVELQDPELISTNARRTQMHAFQELFSKLQARGMQTLVKVVLTSCGSPIFDEANSFDDLDSRVSLLPVGVRKRAPISTRGPMRSRVMGFRSLRGRL
jgi:hypothetical protein